MAVSKKKNYKKKKKNKINNKNRYNKNNKKKVNGKKNHITKKNISNRNNNKTITKKDNNNIVINKENSLYNEIDNKVNDGDSFKYNINKNISIINNNYVYVLVCLYIIFIFGFFLMLSVNSIKLKGDKDIIISYKDSYVEDGYVFNFFNEDLSDDVDVFDNIVNGVVGDYQVNYYIDKLGIRFKKVRNVRIVDDDIPLIRVENDVINICPLDDVPSFWYEAIDEYDGDITSSVILKEYDNEVLLSVKDSSLNENILSVKIDRVDSVLPVIKLKGSSVMYLEYGNKYVEPGYEVSDNCSSNLSDKVSVIGSVGRDIGTYTITYKVIDDSGNESSVSRKVIVGNKVVDNGSINNGSIYLTFDDGPNIGTTNKILDILKEEGVKATFFVTSNGSDDLIKRIYDEGHTVALHTYNHDYSDIYSSGDNYFNDLKRTNDRVKRITGIDSKIIRFPGGSSNMISKNYKIGIMTELSNLVLNQGYRYFDWNVDAMDASSAKNSSDVYYNVVSNLSINRANVVLMHDTKSITVGALRNIIRFCKENNYQFKKIDMNTHMVRHNINN